MCLNCYKKFHSSIIIPKPFYSNKYCCAYCIDGIDFTTCYMFPQIDDFELVDEEIVYQNLYCMECQECNVCPENGKTVYNCFHCNEPFYNLSPKSNNRCLQCIWLHNQPLPKIKKQYCPAWLFKFPDTIPDRHKINVRGKSYIDVSLLEFDMIKFLMKSFKMIEEKHSNQQQQQQKQKTSKYTSQDNEKKVPFGWNPVVDKKRKNKRKQKK